MKMIKRLFFVGAIFLELSVFAAVGDTYGTTVNGIKWVYTTVLKPGTGTGECNASIGGFSVSTSDGLVTAVPKSTSGAIKIPNELDRHTVVEAKDFAFHGCNQLTSVEIPYNLRNVGAGAFAYCYGLMSINVVSNHPYYKSSDGLLLTKDGQKLVAVPCGLSGVTIPDDVTTITDKALFTCTNLTSVRIPESVMSIGACAFNGCSGLTSVTIGNGVKSIGSEAFMSCISLTNVTLHYGVTGIGSEAFFGCRCLENIIIPDSVTNIAYRTFERCNGLTNVVIGNGVRRIGNDAFSGCSRLANVTIGNNVGSIEGEAFSGCSSLTYISIPNSTTSIAYSAFNDCTNHYHPIDME